MCPITAGKMCLMMGDNSDMLLCMGIKIFLLVWVVAVPVIITSRLESIIQLLKEKK